MSLSLSALHVDALLLDIEGTTTPVTFVYTVLFPYARQNVGTFLEAAWSDSACQEAVALLRRERDIDFPDAAAASFGPAEIVEYVGWLMDRDRKSPGLKMLQGLIWQNGYRAGLLRGDVFPDVPRALERWHDRGQRVYIYSSGSILAQQLLFESTTAGDLTKWLSGYFDTAVGPKQSVDSYRAIAQQTRIEPSAMLFVSDISDELDAAQAAGMHTALAVRATPPSKPSVHPAIHSLDEITA